MVNANRGSQVKGKGKPKGEKNKPSSQILGVSCISIRLMRKRKRGRKDEEGREENARLKGPPQTHYQDKQMCLDTHKHACTLHTKIASRLLDA